MSESRSPRHGFFRQVLFCTDFSENADFAFDFAVQAALRNPGCALTLLHVIPEPDAQFWRTYIYEVENVDAKARADIDARIEARYRPRVPASLPFRVVMRIGNTGQQILAVAREREADLLVLGRQGRGAFEKLIFGNVAGKVTRRSPCPVLLVPMDAARRSR